MHQPQTSNHTYTHTRTHTLTHTHTHTHTYTHSLCRDVPAWGAYRGATYNSHGLMRNLVCCDAAFRCSPYQPNNVPVRLGVLVFILARRRW
jgi:hypothetical protein